MLESKIELVGQNLKFDLRFIKALTGVDLTPKYAHDTMVSSHVLDENESAALKFRAQRDLGVDNWLDFDWKALEREQHRDPAYPHCPLLSERVPYYKLARYAMFDVYHTWEMHKHNMQELGLGSNTNWLADEAQNGDKYAQHIVALGDYYLNVSMPAARTLTTVETSGLYVDRYWCEIRQRELAGLVEDTERRLESLSAEFGLEVPENWSTGSLAFQEWAEGMCDAGDLRVVARTGTGKPSWTKEVMGRLDRAGSQSAGLLIKRNKAIKEGAFLKDNLARTTRENPRLYPTFHQASVLTGRLSSSQPNAQQQPKSAKNMFCAAPGRVLIAADFSMIEMRLAANQANCTPMIEALWDNRDLHIMNGASGVKDAALQTAQLLCLWAGVPANGTGCEVLRGVLRAQGGGKSREAIQAGVRKSRPDWTNQEAWSWLWRGSDGEGESVLQGRGDLASGGLVVPELSWGDLRGMWSDWAAGHRQGVGGTSHQRGSFGQSTLKFEDALRLLSQTNAPLLEEVSGLDWGLIRQKGKAIGFGFLFLMGAEKFVQYAEDSYGVEFTYEEAFETRSAFFEMWTGLKEWHRRQIAEANEWGYVRSPLGRIRHAPDAKQAVNSPVQSFASDLMLMSTRRILSTYPQIEVHALVHDAIWCSAPVKIGYSAATGVKHVMEHLVLDDLKGMGVELRVPLVSDVQVGKSLGLMEKL